MAKPVNLYLSDSKLLSFWNCALMHLVVQGSEIVWFFPPSQSSLILHSALSHSQNSELSVRNWHSIQSPHWMTTKQHDVLHHFVELIISFVSGMSSFRVLLQRKQFCIKKHYKSVKRSWQHNLKIMVSKSAEFFSVFQKLSSQFKDQPKGWKLSRPLERRLVKDQKLGL